MLAVLLGAGAASGQPEPGPRKIYTGKTVFKLPVDIKDRAELTALKLFVKAPPGEWACRETAVPTLTGFSFRAAGR